MKKLQSELPIVSIITLTYKNQRFLLETIDSILTQDYPNIELIISDDGSPDFEIDYWESYIHDKYPKFAGRIDVLKNEVNLGTVRNANIAINRATGKYIKLLSSGDLFASPVVVSFLIGEMERNRWKIANSISATYDEGMSSLKGYYPKHKNILKVGQMTAREQYLTLTKYNAIGAAGVLFSKSLFDEVGAFDECYRLTEDWPMWLKLTRIGVKIESIDYVSTKYRLGGISGSGMSNFMLRKDFILLMKKEILCYRELFSDRQWKDLQVQYDKALRWSRLSRMQKLLYLINNCGYFFRHKLMK